jgi:hypothetical protein
MLRAVGLTIQPGGVMKLSAASLLALETRPNNFRIPQLSDAADHPGGDLPAFRYAFEVTGEAAVGQ